MTQPTSDPAAPAAPAAQPSSKVLREWIKFVVWAVGIVAGVVIWFYTQMGAIESRFEAELKDFKETYVSKELHSTHHSSLIEKLSGTVSKDQLLLLRQHVDSLQRYLDSYVKQEGESWAAVKRQSKEIRDLVMQIQLTLARLTR